MKRNQRFLPIEQPTIVFNQKAAQIQLDEMKSSLSLNGSRVFLWYFNKLMRNGLSGLFVDTKSVKMVNELISQNQKVILMPLYKSYADFFIHMYVVYTQKIKPGFTFGNFEDTPRVRVIDALLR